MFCRRMFQIFNILMESIFVVVVELKRKVVEVIKRNFYRQLCFCSWINQIGFSCLWLIFCWDLKIFRITFNVKKGRSLILKSNDFNFMVVIMFQTWILICNKLLQHILILWFLNSFNHQSHEFLKFCWFVVFLFYGKSVTNSIIIIRWFFG